MVDKVNFFSNLKLNVLEYSDKSLLQVVLSSLLVISLRRQLSRRLIPLLIVFPVKLQEAICPFCLALKVYMN